MIIEAYRYDGTGRRTKKHINTGVDQVYDEFRHFYYNASCEFWRVLVTHNLTPSMTSARGGLSPTGNWNDYQIDDNGDGDYVDASDLDQDRTHNLVNEMANSHPKCNGGKEQKDIAAGLR